MPDKRDFTKQIFACPCLKSHCGCYIEFWFVNYSVSCSFETWVFSNTESVPELNAVNTPSLPLHYFACMKMSLCFNTGVELSTPRLGMYTGDWGLGQGGLQPGEGRRARSAKSQGSHRPHTVLQRSSQRPDRIIWWAMFCLPLLLMLQSKSKNTFVFMLYHLEMFFLQGIFILMLRAFFFL